MSAGRATTPAVRGYASRLVREILNRHQPLTTTEIWQRCDFDGSPVKSKSHLKKNILAGFLRHRGLAKAKPVPGVEHAQSDEEKELKQRVGKSFVWTLTDKGEAFEGADLPSDIVEEIERRVEE